MLFSKLTYRMITHKDIPYFDHLAMYVIFVVRSLLFKCDDKILHCTTGKLMIFNGYKMMDNDNQITDYQQ